VYIHSHRQPGKLDGLLQKCFLDGIKDPFTILLVQRARGVCVKFALAAVRFLVLLQNETVVMSNVKEGQSNCRIR
jgi:hypothetical protein